VSCTELKYESICSQWEEYQNKYCETYPKSNFGALKFSPCKSASSDESHSFMDEETDLEKKDEDSEEMELIIHEEKEEEAEEEEEEEVMLASSTDARQMHNTKRVIKKRAVVHPKKRWLVGSPDIRKQQQGKPSSRLKFDRFNPESFFIHEDVSGTLKSNYLNNFSHEIGLYNCLLNLLDSEALRAILGATLKGFEHSTKFGVVELEEQTRIFYKNTTEHLQKIAENANLAYKTSKRGSRVLHAKHVDKLGQDFNFLRSVIVCSVKAFLDHILNNQVPCIKSKKHKKAIERFKNDYAVFMRLYKEYKTTHCLGNMKKFYDLLKFSMIREISLDNLTSTLQSSFDEEYMDVEHAEAPEPEQQISRVGSLIQFYDNLAD
jgi:hypothetical protein